MQVIFSKYAKQELEDAVHHYELEYAGLGKRFREEVRMAALRIVERPGSLYANSEKTFKRN